MGCHCGFRNVAKGYLAQECVVLFESRTNTARSFVLVSALWVLASWIATSPRMCASTPLSPAALIFKRYNKMKSHPYEEGFWDEELMFPGEYCVWSSVSWQSLFNGVGSRDISGAMGKYSLTRRVILLHPKTYLYSFLLIGLPVWCDDDGLHCLICHVGIA